MATTTFIARNGSGIHHSPFTIIHTASNMLTVSYGLYKQGKKNRTGPRSARLPVRFFQITTASNETRPLKIRGFSTLIRTASSSSSEQSGPFGALSAR